MKTKKDKKAKIVKIPVTKFILTVEAEIDTEFVYDPETLIKDLMNQWVKVKSGLYENIASGYITSVKNISTGYIEAGQTE